MMLQQSSTTDFNHAREEFHRIFHVRGSRQKYCRNFDDRKVETRARLAALSFRGAAAWFAIACRSGCVGSDGKGRHIFSMGGVAVAFSLAHRSLVRIPGIKIMFTDILPPFENRRGRSLQNAEHASLAALVLTIHGREGI